jgi:hypothetical protein
MAVVVFSGRLWAVGTRWRGRGSGVQDGAFTPSPPSQGIGPVHRASHLTRRTGFPHTADFVYITRTPNTHSFSDEPRLWKQQEAAIPEPDP